MRTRFILIPLLMIANASFAATVTDSADSGAGTLRDALENLGGDNTITFSSSLTGGDTITTLAPLLPFIDVDGTSIDGSGNTNLELTGLRPFVISGNNVTLSNIKVNGSSVTGGVGGNGGGGGGGLGGTVAISGTGVRLVNIDLSGSATGGNGGIGLGPSAPGIPTSAGGGAGTFGDGGNGGSGSPALNQHGGGGGGGNRADGSTSTGNGAAGGAAGGGGGGGSQISGGIGGPGSSPGQNGSNTPFGFDGGKGGDGGTADGLGGGGGGGGSGFDGTTSTSRAVRGAEGGNGAIGGGGGAGGHSFSTGNPGAGNRDTNIAGDGGNGGVGGGGGAGGIVYRQPGNTVVIFGSGGTSAFLGGVGGNGVQDENFSSQTNIASGGGGGAALGGAIFLSPTAAVTLENPIGLAGSLTGGSGGLGINGGNNGTGGGTAGQEIFMMSGSELTFQIDTGSFTMPNSIESDQGAGGGSTTSGGVNKTGGGVFNLNGAHTFTGTTTISTGTLNLNGSVITDVVTENTGQLTGVAVVANSKNLSNGGVVNPGGINTVGTISVTGNYDQSADGTYKLELGTTTSDLIDVGGTATLNGHLEVCNLNGIFCPGTTFTILESVGGVSGEFASVESGSLLTEVLYNGNNVQLLITELMLDFMAPPPGTGNGKQVFDYILNLPLDDTSDLFIVQDALTRLDEKELARALDLLHPGHNGNFERVHLNDRSEALHAIRERLFPLTCGTESLCCQKYVPWMGAYGNYTDGDPLDQVRGFNARTVGVLLGMDIVQAEGFQGGVVANYSYNDLAWDHNSGDGNVNNVSGGVYARLRRPLVTMDMAFLGGTQWIDSVRKIKFPEVNRTARRSSNGQHYTGHIGFTIHKCYEECYTIEPYGLADLYYYKQNTYEEKGAGDINLAVNAKHSTQVRTELGLLGKTVWNDCWCGCVEPFVRLAWVAKLHPSNADYVSRFVGQDLRLVVKAYDKTTHLLSPSVGFQLKSESDWRWSAGYRGEFNHYEKSHYAHVAADWQF